MKRLMTLGIATLLAVTAWAQVPREMNYSVMVMRPGTGQVVQGKDVSLRLELRQGSADDGTVVWANNYETTTDNNGLCQLRLNFSSAAIDWGKGPYYMALIVDGEEAGAAKFTSVPYALQAASIEGVPTRQELVGTWRSVVSDDEDTTYSYTFVFNEDGTGSFLWSYKTSYHEDAFTIQISRWIVTGSGCLYIEGVKKKDDSSPYDQKMILNVVRLSENQLAINGEDNYETSIYTKIN